MMHDTTGMTDTSKINRKILETVTPVLNYNKSMWDVGVGAVDISEACNPVSNLLLSVGV
jgi:hypothetical protein